jgi:hypothetical protein
MTSPYRIERDRGTKEARQQLAVLREKWPLAFPVEHQDVRPLAMGAARQVAAAMDWSLPYVDGRRQVLFSKQGILKTVRTFRRLRYIENLDARHALVLPGRPVRTLQPEVDYDRPLAVQIAALLHVAGVDAAEGRRGMASLLDKILGLEYAHWNEALNYFRFAD